MADKHQSKSIMDSSCKIHVTNLKKNFGKLEVLKDISLDVAEGEVVVLLGPSGSGKSTLLRCLNQLETATSGQIIIDGHDVTDRHTDINKVRENIGMVFQHFNLFNHLTVMDNMTLAPVHLKLATKEEARRRAEQLLQRVGLEDKAQAYPSQLSGGQKQRVAIARVLANNPKILLCDEATSALDPQTTKSILKLIKEINRDYGITVIVITHEMAVIQEICSRVAVLDHGSMVEEGTVEELFRAPKTEEAKKLILNEFRHIKEMRSERMIRVTFGGSSAFEPFIGNAVLEYKTPLNILYANTKTINGNAEGEMILQLPESKEVADRMIEYFRENNLGVEEVDHYVG